MFNMKNGFTMLELMLAIAIISIITGVVLVAIDPSTRFAETRDKNRFSDVTTILEAAKIDLVDNGGSFLTEIAGLTAGNVAMIGTAGAGCDADPCPDVTIDDAACVDLTGLVTEEYLESIPIAPNGTETYSASMTGYYISRAISGVLTVGACESEAVAEVVLSR